MFQTFGHRSSQLGFSACLESTVFLFITCVVDASVTVRIDSYCGADFCTSQQESADVCVIFSRLKSERERLELTQPAFADLAGAAKRTVIDWEKGVSTPTAAQLAGLAAAGLDVLFVVTGERSQEVKAVDLLPQDERVLLDAYRACNASARRNLIQTAALLSAGVPAPPAGKSGPGQSVVGDSNIQIGSVGAKARIKTR